MHAAILLAVLAVAVPDRPDRSPDRNGAAPNPTTFEEKLLGRWELIDAVIAGNAEKKMDATIITFTPHEVLVRENGRDKPEDTATYNLDKRGKPINIDLTAKQIGDQVIQGIIRIDGDILVLCFDGNPGTRPRAFSSEPNSSTALMRFRRIKN